MEGDEEKSGDFYAVLGLKKEGSMAELKNAYKKLAMVCGESRVSLLRRDHGWSCRRYIEQAQ